RFSRDWSSDVCSSDLIDNISDYFYDFARHSYFSKLSEIFLNKKTTVLFCEYFNKSSLNGSFSPPHQDQAYYNEHFSDELALAFRSEERRVGKSGSLGG